MLWRARRVTMSGVNLKVAVACRLAATYEPLVTLLLLYRLSVRLLVVLMRLMLVLL